MTGIAAERFLSLLSAARCYALLRPAKWPGGVGYPHCGSHHYQHDYQETPKRQYRGYDGDSWWTNRTGTPFAGPEIPLARWFFLLDLVGQGRSSLPTAGEAGVRRHPVEAFRKQVQASLGAARLPEELGAGEPL